MVYEIIREHQKPHFKPIENGLPTERLHPLSFGGSMSVVISCRSAFSVTFPRSHLPVRAFRKESYTWNETTSPKEEGSSTKQVNQCGCKRSDNFFCVH